MVVCNMKKTNNGVYYRRHDMIEESKDIFKLEIEQENFKIAITLFY